MHAQADRLCRRGQCKIASKSSNSYSRTYAYDVACIDLHNPGYYMQSTTAGSPFLLQLHLPLHPDWHEHLVSSRTTWGAAK